MKRWLSIAILAVGLFGCSIRPPFTRISPTVVEVEQIPSSSAVWGAYAELTILGPDTEQFVKDPSSIRRRMNNRRVLADFYSCWNSDRSTWESTKPARLDWEEIGLWRMEPHTQMGVLPGTLIPERTSWVCGRFYKVQRRFPKIEKGWKLIRQSFRKVSLDVDSPNPAYDGGGVAVTIQAPGGWSLKDFGLSQTISVSMTPAVECPYSTWDSPNPGLKKAKYGHYQGLEVWKMLPRVIVEFVDCEVVNQEKSEVKTLTLPTGWVITAGHFIHC